jgi:hypothetical protein
MHSLVEERNSIMLSSVDVNVKYKDSLTINCKMSHKWNGYLDIMDEHVLGQCSDDELTPCMIHITTYLLTPWSSPS